MPSAVALDFLQEAHLNPCLVGGLGSTLGGTVTGLTDTVSGATKGVGSTVTDTTKVRNSISVGTYQVCTAARSGEQVYGNIHVSSCRPRKAIILVCNSVADFPISQGVGDTAKDTTGGGKQDAQNPLGLSE